MVRGSLSDNCVTIPARQGKLRTILDPVQVRSCPLSSGFSSLAGVGFCSGADKTAIFYPTGAFHDLWVVFSEIY
ncbi:hypothetical protein GQ457_15G022390 [Hibiscus cannabinus]